ncbi:glycoside hydrolase family protein [bacterium]|nr:glycoside hydrolase family protein [bacterium]
MNISETGIELIKKFEGCVLKAYKCPAGVWTIGYGHTSGVKEGQTITKAEAEDYLKQDLTTFETYVSNLVTVAINQNQFDALVSFCYNLGPGNLKSSTLLKLLNAKNYSEAAEQFDRWIYAGGKKLSGLVKRRAAEKALFLQPFNTTSYKVIATVLNVRKKPGINNKILKVLYKNDIVKISETSGNWGKLSDNTGWISLKYLKKI